MSLMQSIKRLRSRSNTRRMPLLVIVGLLALAAIPALVSGQSSTDTADEHKASPAAAPATAEPATSPAKPTAAPARAEPNASPPTPNATPATGTSTAPPATGDSTAAPATGDPASATDTGEPPPEETIAPSTELPRRADQKEVPSIEQSGADAGRIQVPLFECEPVREAATNEPDQYPVPLLPFTKGVFPCTRCHDRPDDFNLTKRNLTVEHKDIKLHHSPRAWCYGCHNPTDRDRLRLAGGELVPFEKSYELCGQCHGEKLRDWRRGIHGRRTGCWNGTRQYRLCVHCHNPHSPKFQALTPRPRPRKPSEIK